MLRRRPVSPHRVHRATNRASAPEHQHENAPFCARIRATKSRWNGAQGRDNQNARRAIIPRASQGRIGGQAGAQRGDLGQQTTRPGGHAGAIEPIDHDKLARDSAGHPGQAWRRQQDQAAQDGHRPGEEHCAPRSLAPRTTDQGDHLPRNRQRCQRGHLQVQRGASWTSTLPGDDDPSGAVSGPRGIEPASRGNATLVALPRGPPGSLWGPYADVLSAAPSSGPISSTRARGTPGWPLSALCPARNVGRADSKATRRSCSSGLHSPGS